MEKATTTQYKFFKKLKAALDGRSQRWLAKQIKMSEPALSDKINGQRPFTDDEMKSISRLLNFSLDD